MLVQDLGNSNQLFLLYYLWVFSFQVYINRGNHESAVLNCKDGFEAELRRKYPGDREAIQLNTDHMI